MNAICTPGFMNLHTLRDMRDARLSSLCTISEPENCRSIATRKPHRVLAMWSSFHEATQ